MQRALACSKEAVALRSTAAPLSKITMLRGPVGASTYVVAHDNSDTVPVSMKDLLDQFPIKHNFRSIQIDTLGKVTQDTGLWFLDKEEFKGWFETKGQMLWGIGARTY